MPNLHRTTSLLAASGGVCLALAAAPRALPQGPSPVLDEPWRPQFHFTPASNFMNDPNGLVHVDGEYHLFYQHNPKGRVWGHMSWGHAVSRDLISWEHLPVALHEYGEWMVFSGSAVLDAGNTSGLCAEAGRAEPCLVAIYTAHSESGKRQTQNLAYSRDRGRTWERYAGNPVIDLGMEHFRDPKVFRDEKAGRWVMAVALPKDHKVRFYGSPDLRRWEPLSDFGPAGWTEGDYECPDLVEVPVEQAEGGPATKWVLFVSINPGAPLGGSAVQYFVGSWDGKHFVADEPRPKVRWADLGKDFYAAQSWSNLPPGSPPVWIGWMSNWEYANTEPTETWRGAQSIPRTLALRRVGDDWRLVQRPVQAVETLREPLYVAGGRAVPADTPVPLDNAASDTLDVEVTLAPEKARELGLLLRRGPGEETVVGYDATARSVFVDRTRAGRSDFDARFAGRRKAPVAPAADGSVTLRILLDRSSVEVFAEDGATVITERIYPSPESRGTALFARGGAGRVVDLKTWRMRSAWTARQPGSSDAPGAR